MTKKLNSESVAEVRALDETRDVGHDEAAIVLHLDDAEVRLERGERVIGDLRASGRNTGDQSGFSGVRKADQSDVREKLEFQTEALLFAGTAGFMLRGGLVRGSGEAGVAASAASSAGDGEALAGLCEVVQALAGFLIVNDGAYGDVHVDRT